MFISTTGTPVRRARMTFRPLPRVKCSRSGNLTAGNSVTSGTPVERLTSLGCIAYSGYACTSSVKSPLDAARRWLSSGDFTLEVHAYPEYAIQPSDVNRSTGVPEVTEFPAVRFPEREHFTLGNGLKVILARRTGVPVVEMNMMFDAGYAADQFGLPG